MECTDMALFCNNLASTNYDSSQLRIRSLNQRCWTLITTNSINRKKPIVRIPRSVLEANNGHYKSQATEPARILLERIFSRTQKLEERMNKDPVFSEHVSINLQDLKSDLQNALKTLRNKEEDIQNAEMTVLMEHTELKRAKQNLEQQRKEILEAHAKHEKIEDELERANSDLQFQARQIEDLKLLVEERDREIASTKSLLLLKEAELNNLRNELAKKNEEVKRLSLELESRELVYNEANAVIKKQEKIIEDLHQSVREKEHELEVSRQLQRAEEEKLKVAETKLEKRTVEWFLQQEELQNLAKEASVHMNVTTETMKDLERLRNLLEDVRSELVSSQKLLASSRRNVEDQEQQLEKQLVEINELKIAVTSYSETLRDANLEVKNQRTKLKVLEDHNNKLKNLLSVEQGLVRNLEKQTSEERASLEQATCAMAELQKELEQKTNEFRGAQNLLEVKESELVEARMQIQHLKSVQTSLQLILEGKDADLSIAETSLADLNNEVEELKNLLKNKENQLVQATQRLEVKEEHMQTMQHELDDTKMKLSETQSMVERIAQLTGQLVVSEEVDISGKPGEQLRNEPVQFLLYKQLETELEMLKENLSSKEMEVTGLRRALSAKKEELNMVLGRLNAKEREVDEMKEEKWKDADIITKMQVLVEEKVEGKSVADLAVEKLQLEAAQLEADAAVSALQKLVEMSGMLAREMDTVLNFGDAEFNVFRKQETGTDPVEHISIEAAQKEVAHLEALTQQLVKEAGISTFSVEVSKK